MIGRASVTVLQPDPTQVSHSHLAPSPSLRGFFLHGDIMRRMPECVRGSHVQAPTQEARCHAPSRTSRPRRGLHGSGVINPGLSDHVPCLSNASSHFPGFPFDSCRSKSSDTDDSLPLVRTMLQVLKRLRLKLADSQIRPSPMTKPRSKTKPKSQINPHG